MLGAKHKGVHPGQVIQLDHLGLSMLIVTFHAHSPKGVLGSCQAIFQHNDGAFPVIQCPLQVRSCFYSSSSIMDVTAVPGEGEDLHPLLNHNQRSH
jgi:hypothetical protein